MVAKGKGKDYYKSTYTHDQLWAMLHEGNDWAVEQAGTIWTSAASGMKAAREEMATYVVSLRTQWTGAAAEEFENRMGVVERYSIESEEGMKRVGDITIPKLAGHLKTAQSDAQNADLYPSSNEKYDEWLVSNDIDPGAADYKAKEPQYEQQHAEFLDLRHDAIAQIVADLGDRYAEAKEADFAEPPPPPPSDMPGNSTYQKPTGGVFAENSMSSGADAPTAPDGSATSGEAGADGIVGTEDDLDPVENTWAPGSYTDVDGQFTGGLAGSTGVVPPGGGPGYTTGMSNTSMGGTNLTGGTGLFGPTRSTTGAGTAPGRGTGTGSGTSPARAGASSGSGSRSGTGGANSSGRGSGMNPNRGGVNRGGSSGARGGTRSGYSDDDDDEEYTRETWLREDDVDWGRNRVSDDELDD